MSDEVVILVSSCAMTKYIKVPITFCNKKKLYSCVLVYIYTKQSIYRA